jgi:hypothetical protein
MTLSTICRPCRIDSICHEVGARPFTVRALPRSTVAPTRVAKLTGGFDFGLCGVAILGQSSPVPQRLARQETDRPERDVEANMDIERNVDIERDVDMSQRNSDPIRDNDPSFGELEP